MKPPLDLLKRQEALVASLTFLSPKAQAALLRSFECGHPSGLNLNPERMHATDFIKRYPEVQAVAGLSNHFHYDRIRYPFGRHPYFSQGVYYLSDSSASQIVPQITIDSSMRVADLAAAPGGKAFSLLLKNPLLLLANDLSRPRVQVLRENLAKTGRGNYIITNTDLTKLPAVYESCFDVVLLDAPCSMETQAGSNPEALIDWSLKKVAELARIQKQLITAAFALLAPGGVLYYSTCTFNEEENEGVVRYLLETTPSAELVTLAPQMNSEHGIKMPEALRWWPFNAAGNGHFLAAIRRLDGTKRRARVHLRPLPPRVKRALNLFYQHALVDQAVPECHLYHGQVYAVPPDLLPLFPGVVDYGLLLGEVKGETFIPSHPLALALNQTQVRQVLSVNGAEAEAYLAGASLTCCPTWNGFILICFDGLPLGWGKAKAGNVKNYLPRYLIRATKLF